MSLIGRESELQILRDHLRKGRNLAVSGPPGVGKTALVQEAIRERNDALYCANSATLKTACESLLPQLGVTAAIPDNVTRKRMILNATAGGKRWFVFDHVSRVSPKLAAFLENIHEAHRMIVVTRNLAWSEIGHLKTILWDFDVLELHNLSGADARALIGQQISEQNLTVPDPQQFEHDLLHLSRGNPRRILEWCAQAANGHYLFGKHFSTHLVELDRRIANWRRPH